MSFGERLKKYREKCGLTQEDIAGFLGGDISRQAVSKWERNECFPELEKVLVLSVKLHVTLDELFSDELSYLKRAIIVEMIGWICIQE